MDYTTTQLRVRVIKGFYIHLAIYLTIISSLYFIDLLTGNSWWFYWPALGWEVAGIINGVVVFLEGGILSTEWEEHKIKQLMSKGGD